jgi:hypothetical protein
VNKNYENKKVHLLVEKLKINVKTHGEHNVKLLMINRKTLLRSLQVSWNCGHSQNVGAQAVRDKLGMDCVKFRRQRREAKAVDPKEKSGHKNSASYQACITKLVNLQEEKLQKLNTGRILQADPICADILIPIS